MSGPYLEAKLSPAASDIHRALASLQEELEATDYYNQRADSEPAAELKAVLIHNRNEEIEHASMLLEWLRRNMPEFDAALKTYLFTKAPITAVEAAGKDTANSQTASDGSLGIGR